MGIGVAAIIVLTVGFPLGLCIMLARMYKKDLRTDINYIERFGWVPHSCAEL
jgi:hypothetical protein